MDSLPSELLVYHIAASLDAHGADIVALARVSKRLCAVLAPVVQALDRPGVLQCVLKKGLLAQSEWFCRHVSPTSTVDRVFQMAQYKRDDLLTSLPVLPLVRALLPRTRCLGLAMYAVERRCFGFFRALVDDVIGDAVPDDHEERFAVFPLANPHRLMAVSADKLLFASLAHADDASLYRLLYARGFRPSMPETHQACYVAAKRDMFDFIAFVVHENIHAEGDMFYKAVVMGGSTALIDRVVGLDPSFIRGLYLAALCYLEIEKCRHLATHPWYDHGAIRFSAHFMDALMHNEPELDVLDYLWDTHPAARRFFVHFDTKLLSLSRRPAKRVYVHRVLWWLDNHGFRIHVNAPAFITPPPPDM